MGSKAQPLSVNLKRYCFGLSHSPISTYIHWFYYYLMQPSLAYLNCPRNYYFMNNYLCTFTHSFSKIYLILINFHLPISVTLKVIYSCIPPILYTGMLTSLNLDFTVKTLNIYNIHFLAITPCSVLPWHSLVCVYTLHLEKCT